MADIEVYMSNNKKITESIDKSMQDYYKYVEKALVEEFAKLIKAGGSVKTITERLYNAAEWKDVANNIAGVRTDMLDNIFKLYNEEIENLKTLYPRSEFQSVTIRSVWNELAKIDASEIFDLAQVSKSEIMVKLQAASMTLVTGNIKAIVEYYKTSLSGTIGQIKNEVFTMQGILFNKMRTNYFKGINTKEIKKYMYLGVVDGKTRAFCLSNVGKARTELQWKAINNGQKGTGGGDAFAKLGGWGCRHMLLLVPEDKNLLKELEDVGKTTSTN